jgi:hypothetical protein
MCSLIFLLQGDCHFISNNRPCLMLLEKGSAYTIQICGGMIHVLGSDSLSNFSNPAELLRRCTYITKHVSNHSKVWQQA